MPDEDYDRLFRKSVSRGVKLRASLAKTAEAQSELAKLRAERDSLRSQLEAAGKPIPKADDQVDEKPKKKTLEEVVDEDFEKVGGNAGRNSAGLGRQDAKSKAREKSALDQTVDDEYEKAGGKKGDVNFRL